MCYYLFVFLFVISTLATPIDPPRRMRRSVHGQRCY